jgi:hypothetical protein
MVPAPIPPKCQDLGSGDRKNASIYARRRVTVIVAAAPTPTPPKCLAPDSSARWHQCKVGEDLKKLLFRLQLHQNVRTSVQVTARMHQFMAEEEQQ